ncbi:MAG TPA: patatin-like phospholipase family protein [Longimicrobiaceae bacterium]|nr:patatin-like phospholipase family protein [Longimicrobiaceae bacterium]
MGKTALVISGGGSKGSFAVGALKYLVGELGMEFDVLAGTSTGALIVPLLAARGRAALPVLETAYTTRTHRDILSGSRVLRVLRGEPSFYGTDPLRQAIEAHVDQEVFEALRASPRQMAVTTTDFTDRKLVYWQTGPSIATHEPVVQVKSRDELVKAMLASASVPVAMPPVALGREGRPEDVYVDGGVREYAPIRVAIDAGATDICCIILSPPRERRPHYTPRSGNVFDVLQHTIDLLTEGVGEADVKLSTLYTRSRVYVNAVRAKLLAAGVDPEVVEDAFAHPGVPDPLRGKVAVSLRIIRPKERLRSRTLEFNPVKMRADLETGYRTAKEQWPVMDALPRLSFARAPAAV